MTASSDKNGEPMDHETLERNADAVNRALQEYLAGYEFRGDGGYHTPNDAERLLIEDAIQGLMVEDEFVEAFVRMHNEASRSASVGSEEVCGVCGGRAMACRVLGHRPESDRHIQWQATPSSDVGSYTADKRSAPRGSK